MNKSPLPSALLAVLALCALGSAYLTISYTFKIRELRQLQTQVAIANNYRATLNALANDAMEYSKRNPAIDPILVSIGAKPGPNSPAPAAKPAGK